MVGIRAALSHSSNMDICGGGGSAVLPASGGNAIMAKNNNLTIQVNDPGQQDVVSQPSGTVIVNCYKDTSISGYREESESSVCIKVQGGNGDKEGKKKRCNVNSAKKSRSTQCEDHLGGGDQLFVAGDNEEISVARVNDQSIERSSVQNNAVRDESAIKNSDHANVVIHNSSSCSGLDNSTSSSSTTTTNSSNHNQQQQHHQIETDTNKDTTTIQMHQSSRKSFKSTEAQTDNHFLQPNQTNSNAAEQSSSAASVPGPPPSAAAASLAVAMQINPGMAGQSREERRRERRERRQNRAQNQAGRHCHPNVRVSNSGGGGGGAVPPYEILPDLVNNPHHTHHLLPPPYSTLPLGSTMSTGGHHHPPPIIPRMPVAHHHHHHMAIQRLRSTSPPHVPTPLIMQAPPPPGPILQPVPVASIANVVGEDPRFLFQLPVIRR